MGRVLVFWEGIGGIHEGIWEFMRENWGIPRELSEGFGISEMDVGKIWKSCGDLSGSFGVLGEIWDL